MVKENDCGIAVRLSVGFHTREKAGKQPAWESIDDLQLAYRSGLLSVHLGARSQSRLGSLVLSFLRTVYVFFKILHLFIRFPAIAVVRE